MFRELGELQIENTAIGAPDDIVCNCTQTTCARLQALMGQGCTTLEQLADRTHVTMVCGGCKPLIEELLGSASLAVAELVKKESLGLGITRFQFRPVNQPVTASLPGQHILLQGRIHNHWVTRAYTLTSPAAQTDAYEITVKREETGEFSRWLCDRADEESLFRISEPQGEFVLEERFPAVVFFAGGIGVTPAIAMMRTLAQRGDNRTFHLDWSAPYPESFVFQPELEQLTAQHPQLRITLRPTRRVGKLQPADLQQHYRPSPGTIAMLCGPESFMAAIQEALLQAGWTAAAIRQERFGSHLNQDGTVQKNAP
ncbi:hypothetical protein DO97_07000 [Neosynechococcus sphagnicola sy1]|uniref:FAD-binding FR-type domain-containing protein n=1 Tax=Neosynechococcus sphagnicola sy1 TaxID=1497020 RepID=A0A098TK30_9CYAN|nr:FAD-binding oxidoreductase [Neosynechococcus sphagnicola]KGF72664.1 hypothetical protein DO97_07000 [Neosynechococcus sphagnicola sy1]